MKQLFNLGKVLSREQMKNITGGTTCVWTNVSGFQSPPGTCDSDPYTCQGDADRICEANPSCSDVDCN